MNGNGVVSRIAKWASQPFSTPMSLWQIFLLTGLVLISAMLWNKVLHQISEY